MKDHKIYGISGKNVSEENLVFKYINDAEASGSTSFVLPKRRMGYGINFIGTVSTTDLAKQLELVDETLINSGSMSAGALFEHLKNPAIDHVIRERLGAHAGRMSESTLQGTMDAAALAVKVMRGRI